jgi:uncharacterized protein YcfJ
MAKRIISIMVIIAVSMASMFIIGCQSGAQTGTVIGALAGGTIGQLAGGDTEATLIGAAVGGTAGYFLGNESDKEKAHAEREGLRQEMNTVMVKVTNSNGSIVRVPLKKQGVGYVGTKGEYYATLPTEDQLRPVYGF